MIGVMPIAQLVPLDYRYALDAAMTVLHRQQPVLIRCHSPELEAEIRQRIVPATHKEVRSALWVEPSSINWRSELMMLGLVLPVGAPLVIIASQPLARLLPERRDWGGYPLGLTLMGGWHLRRALGDAGFSLTASYGIHSPLAIGLSLLSRQLDRWGWPHLSDRLHFAARLYYCLNGPLAPYATVSLLVAVRTYERQIG